MAILGIIQARIDSSRMDKKMVSMLGGYRILDWVIARTKKSKLIDNLIIATSTDDCDDIIVDIANEHKLPIYRGNKNNVLDRFVNTAKNFKGDTIVRICADNPFIYYKEIDELIDFFKKNHCDLAFNHKPILNSKIADGFGAEIFSSKLLRNIQTKKLSDRQNEHVTKYIWDNQNKFNIRFPDINKNLAYPNLKFDIDTNEDLKKFNNFVAKNSINFQTSSSNIVKLYKKEYLDK
tara:strand:+ start:70 stop:774 length:705 start_codon:yes stop_codon:yes gene_type:complete